MLAYASFQSLLDFVVKAGLKDLAHLLQHHKGGDFALL